MRGKGIRFILLLTFIFTFSFKKMTLLSNNTQATEKFGNFLFFFGRGGREVLALCLEFDIRKVLLPVTSVCVFNALFHVLKQILDRHARSSQYGVPLSQLSHQIKFENSTCQR
jgi:hypothetical protein